MLIWIVKFKPYGDAIFNGRNVPVFASKEFRTEREASKFAKEKGEELVEICCHLSLDEGKPYDSLPGAGHL